MNSYLIPEYHEPGELYAASCTKECRDGGKINYACLYTRDIIQPYQYSKVFKYYVYLKEGTRNKIDGISTEIMEGCVGTLISTSPIKIPRGTFTPAHESKSRPVGVRINVEMDPLILDDDDYYDDINSMESIIENFRLEALNERDSRSIEAESVFGAIKYYRFDDDNNATIEFCKSTRGSYRVAKMIGEKVRTNTGTIMATARRIETDSKKCFIINYVWVDGCGFFDYRGSLDDCRIVFNYKFTDEEVMLTQSQYDSIVKKWKDKWPNC